MTYYKARLAPARAGTNCRQVQQWAMEGKLRYRLTDHALGRGARLTQVQRQAGGTWVVADVVPGTRDRETQLKERGASRRCSVCKAVRDIQVGELTKEQALARWENASPADRAVLREIFGMEPAPDPVPEPAPFVPRPAPEPITEIPPEMDALIDALVAGWKAEAASSKAEAEPEMEAEAG